MRLSRVILGLQGSWWQTLVLESGDILKYRNQAILKFLQLFYTFRRQIAIDCFKAIAVQSQEPAESRIKDSSL